MSEWTLFWDMSSGGTQKLDWKLIFIEAPEYLAKGIFEKMFDRDPENVTCDCCGEDYSISESETLKQASGYHRHCKSLKTPIDKKGLFKNDDPIIKKSLYLDDGDSIPKGYEIDERWSSEKSISFKEFLKNPMLINARIVYRKEWGTIK